ncbi:MAG: glycosyltransferase [Oscillochloridaceae bacterium umkhey_bin13]
MQKLALAAGATLLLLLGYARDQQRLRQRPRISGPTPIPPKPPQVNLLIPARNEERAIARCVQGALNQTYPAYDVTVVNDGSTDRTGTILAQLATDPRLHVLDGRPLPTGWVGKCNVCQQLSEAATGEWLLFLDADTAPQPELVAALIDYATTHQLDLVSLFPFLELGSFWERVIMPPFLALIAALYPFERMTHPDARPDEVVANGQCLLVRRSAYEAIGGHGAVRAEVLEDVQLAQAMRRAGFRVGGAEGLHLLRVRMYTNGREVAEGLIKNAAAGARSGGWRSSWIAMRQMGLALGPLWLIGAGLVIVARGAPREGRGVLALGLLSFSMGLRLWATLYQRLYRLNPAYALIWPFGQMGYLLLAAWGMWQVRRGRGVVWKGRRYAG